MTEKNTTTKSGTPTQDEAEEIVQEIADLLYGRGWEIDSDEEALDLIRMIYRIAEHGGPHEGGHPMTEKNPTEERALVRATILSIIDNSSLWSDDDRLVIDRAAQKVDAILSECPPRLPLDREHRDEIARLLYSVWLPDNLWPHISEESRVKFYEGADALLERFAVLAPPTEEWEYGLLNPGTPPRTYGGDGRAHLVSRNREHIERQHRRGHPVIQFVRRHPATEWEPVPTEGDK